MTNDEHEAKGCDAACLAESPGPLASERWWKQSGPQTSLDFGMFAALDETT